jgi:hypothetical protein
MSFHGQSPAIDPGWFFPICVAGIIALGAVLYFVLA